MLALCQVHSHRGCPMHIYRDASWSCLGVVVSSVAVRVRSTSDEIAIVQPEDHGECQNSTESKYSSHNARREFT